MTEHNAWKGRFAPWIGAAFAALCVLTVVAYAGLLPYGHWQPDEYQNLVSFRKDPDNFFWTRLATWSPRPVSELFVYAYLRAVEGSRQPLIGEALAGAWLFLGGCLAFPVLVSWSRHGGRLSELLTLPLCLLCVFLVGHPVAEMFYWPMAALAYVTTLAGIVLIFGVTEYGSDDKPRDHLIIVLALLFISLSSEVGAMFVVVYVAAAVMLSWLPGSEPIRRERSIGLFVAFGVALEVIRRLVHGRVALNGETFGDPRYIHHALPSILAAAPHAMWEWVSSSSVDIDAQHLVEGAVAKTAFFVGAFVMARRTYSRAARQGLRLPLLVASVAIVPVTLAAAYYQFGMMACCERHATFRQCMDYVALATGAACFASTPFAFKRRLTTSVTVGFGCLSLSVAIGLASSVAGLRSDYARRSLFSMAIENTWRSGGAAGSTMQMRQVVPGRVVGGYPLFFAQNYTLKAGMIPEIQALLDFFDKSEVKVTDPIGVESEAEDN